MTAVIVQSGATIAGGSGNTGWSARSLFRKPAHFVAVRSDLTTGSTSFSSFGLTAPSTTIIAQSFTPASSITLDALAVILGGSGSPTDNLTVDITTDNSNKPSATVLGTSDPISGSAVPNTTLAWSDFTFSTPVSLSGGVKYWMKIQRSGALDNGNYYRVGLSSSIGYSGGDLSTYDGASWTRDTVNDLRFRVIAAVSGSLPLYQVTQDSALHVYTSTDDGATWTEQDSAHAPSVNSSTSSWSAYMSQWGEIAVAYFSGANTLRVRQFDTVTNTWASADLAGANVTTDADPLSPINVSCRDPYISTIVTWTSITDTADLTVGSRAANTWSSQPLLAATSAERSVLADMPVSPGVSGFSYPIYYDAQNDDFSFRSLVTSSNNVLSNWTELDSDTTAATTESSHASAVFEPYDNGSGVAKIVAAYIDANDSLQERTMLFAGVSTSVTLGTQHQVSASTSYAGQKLATCEYNGDLYVFASTATTIDYWVDTGATGTWGSVNNWKTGLSSCSLSHALAVDSTGIIVSYMDGGNVVIDWAVDGPAGGGDVNVAGTTATASSAASAGSVSIPRSITGSTATATGSANAGTLSYAATVNGTTAIVSSLANAGSLTYGATISGATAAAIGSANAGSLSYAATVSGVTASATATATAGTVQAGASVTGSTATATSAANAGSVTYGANVAGTGATASATANAGSLSIPRNITGTTATASAAAHAGTRTYGANITGTTATATGTANAGTVASGTTVAGTTATVTAAAIAGSLSYAATVTGTTATATASANAGSLSYAASATGTTATAIASANAGSIAIAATVNGTTATVNAAANAGSLSIAPNVAGQTATATASASIGQTASRVDGLTASVQGVAIAGTIVTGTAATVTGATATIVIDAYAGTTTQIVIAGRLLATLSHASAVSASIDHDERIGATIEHSGVLSARLEKV